MLKRILLVDGNLCVREYISAFIKQMTSAEILTCENGNLALELLCGGLTVDLIMLSAKYFELNDSPLLKYFAATKIEAYISVIPGVSCSVLSALDQLPSLQRLKIISSIGKPYTAAGVKVVLDQIQLEQGRLMAEASLKSYKILDALNKGVVEPWFQPQVASGSKKIRGFEVLCRICHRRHGILLPKVFLSTLERSELIYCVTFDLILAALTKFASAPTGLQTLSLSLNIPAKLLLRSCWVDDLLDLIDRSLIDNSRVIIEIEESDLLTVPLTIVPAVTRLTDIGCGVAIDCYGCDIGSLSQLPEIPFTEVKAHYHIQSKGTAPEHENSRLAAIIQRAHNEGLNVVIEGVEHHHQWQAACYLASDFAQGYFIAQPMPFEQIGNWIEHWQGDE